MRRAVSLLMLLVFAVATMAAAGAAPMGGVAHQQAMAVDSHSDHRHSSGHPDGHHHDGRSEGTDCPASIMACAGMGIAPPSGEAIRPAGVRSEPWELVATVGRARDPALEERPPKV